MISKLLDRIKYRPVEQPECCTDRWRFYAFNVRVMGFRVHIQLKGPHPPDLPDCQKRNCMGTEDYL